MANNRLEMITNNLVVRPPRRTLDAVSGIRMFATLWIVLGHFQETSFLSYQDTTFLLVLNRGFVGVAVYIVLSGFITHYAYRNKEFFKDSAIGKFYVKRFGRVCFTYFVSLLLGVLDTLWTRHETTMEHVLASVFLVQSWFEVSKSPAWSRYNFLEPNPAGWTISTLAFAWILYPLLNLAFKKMFPPGSSITKKLFVFSVVYLINMAPCLLLYLVQEYHISNQQFELLYKLPLLRLGDFILGMLAAELLQEAKSIRWMPDIVTLGFVAIVSLLKLDDEMELSESQPYIRQNAEAFLICGLSPLICAILVGFSSRTFSEPSIRYVLEYRSVVDIGQASFTVYCFEFFFFFAFEKWQFVNTQIGDENKVYPKLIATYLLPYLVTLYVFSVFWTVTIENPVANFIARKISRPTIPQVEELRKVPSVLSVNGASSKKMLLSSKHMGSASTLGSFFAALPDELDSDYDAEDESEDQDQETFKTAGFESCKSISITSTMSV